MSASKLEMWMSPLTNRIFIGKSRADRQHGRVATQKQDVTAQCINGAVAHLVAENDLEIIVTLDEGKRYRVRITPEAA
jgi:aspartate 1-decarboxylase